MPAHELELRWTTSAPREQTERLGHRLSIVEMVVTPDGRYILSFAFQNRTMIVWDAQTGQLERRDVLGSYEKVRTFAVAPDSSFLMYGYEGLPHSSCMIDLQSWVSSPFGSDRQMAVTALAITPDGKQAIMGTDYETFALRVYDLQTQEIVRSLPEQAPLLHQVPCYKSLRSIE